MRVVVADAGPVNYLIQIEQINLLPALFSAVHLPEKVWSELRHDKAAPMVRQWMLAPPSWVEVAVADSLISDPSLDRLDDGERAAIQLAVRIKAELILMDDREGVFAARRKGFAVTGTLGILDLAARRGLIQIEDAFERLRATNFRCRPEIMEAILAAYKA